MSADWKEGDKAVCVDDIITAPNAGAPDCIRIKKGVIYLVSGDGVRHDGKHGIALAPNPAVRGYLWRSERFRKIVPACDRASKSTSISTFTFE